MAAQLEQRPEKGVGCLSEELLSRTLCRGGWQKERRSHEGKGDTVCQTRDFVNVVGSSTQPRVLGGGSATGSGDFRPSHQTSTLSGWASWTWTGES